MKNINYFKTLYYNFHFWGLKGLCKLPLIIHSGVVLKDMSGKITLMGDMRRGMLRFGSPEPLATFDMRFERTTIDISGEMVAYDNVHIAQGSRISINEGAVLTLGKDFNSTGNCAIICDKNISFGEGCLLSWDILIMDADFHKIYDRNDEHINPSKNIEIGDNVWICCRVTILKGTKIPNSCVIGAASVVTGKYSEEGCIISGNGNNCRVVKRNIHWRQ